MSTAPRKPGRRDADATAEILIVLLEPAHLSPTGRVLRQQFPQKQPIGVAFCPVPNNPQSRTSPLLASRRSAIKSLGISLLVASSLACGLGTPAAWAQTTGTTKPAKHWVGTWGNSSPTGLSPTGYNNQTIRVMAHVSLGGTRTRVRLTNLFGTEPLTIGAAHVALRAAGTTTPDIQAGTDRVLTFSGQTAIAIPKGATILSDPIDLTIPALSDVAVSVFLPDNTGPVTYHAGVPKTSFVSAGGNHAGDTAFPVGSTTTTLPIVSDIDVFKPGNVGAIVALGDSITQGLRSTTDQDNRWSDQPAFLAYRLVNNTPDTASAGSTTASSTVQGRAVINEGISGNRFLHDVAGPNLVARFDTDVLIKAGVSHVIVLISINDISGNGTDDARQPTADPNNTLVTQDFIAGYRQIIARAHDKGIKIYGATVTPFNTLAAPGEAIRQGINAYIRTSGEFDGVVDFDAAIRDPNDPTKFRVEYNSGDGLHPSDAGYSAMGNSIDLNLFN